MGHQWVTAGALLLIASQAQASAWNPQAGKGEVINGYVWATADDSVDEFGRKIPVDIYTKRTSQNYGVLGITDRLALVSSFDWQDAQIVSDSLDTAFSEASKLQAGLQYQLHRAERRAVAVSLSYTEGIDLPVALLTLEGREATVELRGLWGESRTFAGKSVFAEAQLAGQMELGGRYAGTRGQFTLGGAPFSRTQLLAKLRHVDIPDGSFERLAIAGQSRTEAEASAVYNIWRDAFLEIGYVATVRANNAVRERGLKVGLWTKF